MNVPAEDLYKYSDESGTHIAASLLTLFDRLKPDWNGKDVLDFGCHWGCLLNHIAETKLAKSLTGIDIKPHWEFYESIHGHPPHDRSRVRLICGDVLNAPELQGESFDLIVTASTLFALSIDYLECVVDWFYQHLRPGGCILAFTRTILSYNGMEYMSQLGKIPYAHLLFPEKELHRYLRGKGLPLSTGLAPYVPFAGSTYIMLFKQAGFDIDDVLRVENQHLASCRAKHLAKISPYNAVELNTAEIVIFARRPDSPYPLERFWKGNRSAK